MKISKIKYIIPFLGILYVCDDTKKPEWVIVATIWHCIYLVLLINGLLLWL